MNTKFGIISIAALALFLTGCAIKDADFITYKDHFKGEKLHTMTNNLIPDESDPGRAIWLNASSIDTPSSLSDYYLEVHYEARPGIGFLNIPSGRTLEIQADGEVMTFIGPGSSQSRDHNKEGNCVENAIYIARARDLMTIANASTVTLKIKGENDTVSREFTKENFEKFNYFVEHYIY
ncbi:MAG: hypothetical protein K9N48_07660 [Verrucomicrobia bacterium]|nr:hypothetical protein [Verrucomicrobiota bacterium]MCF7708642.1 hypothetical protein [Verrucomicrobiota bacterium]